MNDGLAVDEASARSPAIGRRRTRGARVSVVAGLAGVLWMHAATVAFAADLPATTGRDWPAVGGDAGNTRFSPLSQITRANASKLGGAWVRSLDTKTRAAPVVVDGVIYMSDGVKIYALDARSGASIWEYATVGSTPARGGVAVADGKVYCGLADTRVLALDQKTGKLLWTGYIGNAPKEAYDARKAMAFWSGFPSFDPKIGFITSAPTVLNGRVVIGLTGGDGGTRSKIAALDATTGELVWEWWVVPSAGEPGSETWPDDIDATQLGGGAVWTHGAADARLGLVYFGTGNATPMMGGEVRPGDNLYTASLVALDVATGKLKWHFQLTRHDIWEMDVSTPPILYDFKAGRRVRKAIAVMRTDGYLFALDRATGEPLIPIENRPVPQDIRQRLAATQPFPKGADQVGPNCVEPDVMPPGFTPGCYFDALFYDTKERITPFMNVRYAPMAYDAKAGRFFVPAGVSPWWYRREENPYITQNEHPPLAKEYGLVVALDDRAHKRVWQQRSPWSLVGSGGVLATAGGVLFRSEGDGHFLALDARNGEQLWKFQMGSLPGPTVVSLTGSAPAATYEVEGVQYVVVANDKNVWAFKLNGRLAERQAPATPPTEYGFTGIVETLGPDDEIAMATLQPTRAPGVEHFVDEASFAPSRAQVAAGQAVRFTNYGVETHTIVASDGSWTTGPIAPGTSATVRIAKPGKYIFFAQEFPWSKGQLLVQ
jgi:glucose dehydrogenase/plastocyanin